MAEDNLTGKQKSELLKILNASAIPKARKGRPPLREDEKTRRIGFTIPEEMEARFAAAAAALGKSKSKLFRDVIEKFLDHYEKQLKLQKYW